MIQLISVLSLNKVIRHVHALGDLIILLTIIAFAIAQVPTLHVHCQAALRPLIGRAMNSLDSMYVLMGGRALWDGMT